MGKKERSFPLNTIGGRIYALRNNLGYSGDAGRIDFYNFLYSDEPGEKNIHDESKRKNVYNWECSKDTIPIPIIKKISQKCDCSSDYLLGIEKETNHDLHFVCNYTGLSENAVNSLQILRTPYDPSVMDSLQTSRYDIIALNYILEDFYDNEKGIEDYQRFSTDTVLNQIGQYIDSNSAKFGTNTPILCQNGNTTIFSPGDVAMEIVKTRIFESLQQLKERYSLDILIRRKEHSEYFDKCFKKHINDSNAD